MEFLVVPDIAKVSIDVLAGALIPLALFAGQKAVAKAQATMDLLREFNSAEFATVRSSARRLIMKYPNLNYTELADRANE